MKQKEARINKRRKTVHYALIKHFAIHEKKLTILFMIHFMFFDGT